MAIYVFYLKLILAIYLLYKLVKLAFSNHKEKNTLLIFVISFIVIVDVRSIIQHTTSQNTVSEVAILLFLLYFFVRVVGESSKSTSIMRSFIDLKALFDSEIIDKLEEGVALIKSESLEVITSNVAFKLLLGEGVSFVKLPDVVSAVSRGEDFIEIIDFQNKKRIIKARLIQYGKKFAIIYVNDVTHLEHLSIEYKSLNKEIMATWENAPNLVMLRDENGFITFMNDAMASFLHKSKTTLVGKQFKLIYNKEIDYDRHYQMHQKLINEEVDRLKVSFHYSYPLNSLGFVEVEEQLFYLDGKKYILTNAVDITQSYYLALLQNAFTSIHMRPGSQQHKTYVVVDLIRYDILFKERISSLMITSLGMFINDLDEDSKIYMDDIILGKKAFEQKVITYKTLHSFYVEQSFYAQNGDLVGLLLKYLNPEVALYSQSIMGSMIMNHIKEGLLVVNQNGNIEYHNEMIQRILNYDSDEFNDVNIKEITLGLTDDVFNRNMELIKQHSSLHFERIYVTKDGLHVPTEVVAMNLEHEQTNMMLLLIRDISEKFIYKKRLIDSQSRYAQIFESLQDGVIEIRLPDKTVSIFREFDHEKGLVGLEISFLQWLNSINDRDRSIVYEAIDIITSELSQNYVFEYRYFKKSGWEWFRATGKYIESDEGASIVIINQNISEIKNITQKLEESHMILTESERIASMSHWKFIIPKNLFIVSKSFSGLIQHKTDINELYYESFLEAIYPVDLSYFEYKFEKFIWNNESLDIIIRFHNHGKVVFLNMIGQVYFDDEKMPVYAIGSLTDVSDKMQSKQRFEESRMLLENVVEQVPMGLIVIRSSGIIEKVNHSAMKMLKIDPLSIHNTDDLKNFLSDRFNEFDAASFDKMLSSTTNKSKIEMLLNSKNTQIRLTSNPMSDSDKQYIGRIINVSEEV